MSVMFINVILSGDNSIVIALAVQTLPRDKRNWGLLIGAGAAAALRIGFTFVAVRLLGTPYLKLIGGALILWIAVKLLAENEDPDPRHKQAHSVFHAVWIITVADVTMSLDNVLAVAGAARGSATLLWTGLGTSIPLVVFASGLLSRLMERFPAIVIIGAAMLGKVGGEMIAGDPALRRPLAGLPHADHWFAAAGAFLILMIGAWLARRKRRLSSAGKTSAV